MIKLITMAIPVLGVLINQIEGAYFSLHWRVLCEWASEKSARLVFFSGKALNSPDSRERIQNSVYGLVKGEVLDGLLVLSGSLGNCISRSELATSLGRWKSLPMVSINYPLDSFTSVRASSRSAVGQLVRHLAVDHGYRDFGIVTGLSSNYDSVKRMSLIKDAFDKHNLYMSGDRIFNGDFTPGSGEEAAAFFQRAGLPEAVICFNDDMAHSMIETFRSNGIAVPSDVAVTGFDGYAYTEHMFPALTTVEQPFPSITEKAADLLLEMIESGESQSKEYSEECRLRVRQSCGCLIPRQNGDEKGTVKKPGKSEIIDLNQVLSDQFRLIGDCLENRIPESHIHEMYLDELSEPDSAEKTRLLRDLYLINSSISGQIQYKRTYDFFINQWRFRNFSSRISGQVNLKDLLGELILSLSEINIKFLRLYLFADTLNYSAGIPDLPEEIKLHIDYREGEISFFSDTGKTVALLDILQAEKSTVIQTLYFGSGIFGFIQVGIGNHYDALYEGLRDIVSISLHQAYINREMQSARRQLELSLTETRMLQKKFKFQSIRDQLTGLLNRRGFLEMAGEILESAGDDESFYIFYMDLDGLKKVNDSYGHKAGDWAISSFARALERSFRSNDLLARLGGEEFTALARTGEPEYEYKLKKRLNAVLDDMNRESEMEFKLSSSVGHILFRNAGGNDLNDLLDQADSVLYEEKKAKRGQ